MARPDELVTLQHHGFVSPFGPIPAGRLALVEDPPPSDDNLGEWVELALEGPNGDELMRMLRQSQPEEAAWRRIQAAERAVSSLLTARAA